VNFSPSLYEVMENDGLVILTLELSQASSVPFNVTINTMDVTAIGRWIVARI